MVGLSLLNRTFSDCRIMIIHYCMFVVNRSLLVLSVKEPVKAEQLTNIISVVCVANYCTHTLAETCVAFTSSVINILQSKYLVLFYNYKISGQQWHI